MAHSWTCLYCNRPTTLTDNDLSQHNYRLFENSKYGKVGIGWNAARCPNPGCAEISLYVSFEKRGEFVVSGELKHIYTVRKLDIASRIKRQTTTGLPSNGNQGRLL